MASENKYILKSMGEIMDTLKEESLPKITPKVVFALSPGYAHLSDGLRFVYAMVELFSEGKYDVIISAPNREVDWRNLRPLRAELSNISKRCEWTQSPFATLDEVLALEQSIFHRQPKSKPGIIDDHRVIVAISNGLWFRSWRLKNGEKRENSKETKAHLEAMVLRTKPEANKWLHLTPRIAALGTDAFERGPAMITKIHAYLVKKLNLAENAEETPAEIANSMCQLSLEAFWTQNVRGDEGFDMNNSILEGVGSRMDRVLPG